MLLESNSQALLYHKNYLKLTLKIRLSSMIILFKSNVNWLHYANDKNKQKVI